jgi:hypothetical protein
MAEFFKLLGRACTEFNSPAQAGAPSPPNSCGVRQL